MELEAYGICAAFAAMLWTGLAGFAQQSAAAKGCPGEGFSGGFSRRQGYCHQWFGRDSNPCTRRSPFKPFVSTGAVSWNFKWRVLSEYSSGKYIIALSHEPVGDWNDQLRRRPVKVQPVSIKSRPSAKPHVCERPAWARL
jgi:hypothetical protein